CWRPAIYRQRKRCLADEYIALQRFKRRTGGIELAFVVAGHHPDAALMFDPNLCRSQYVAGGMQGDASRTQRKYGSVIHRSRCSTIAQAMPGKRHARGGNDVVRAAMPQMVTMSMRDDRAGDGL